MTVERAETIQLAHGSGGRRMSELVEKLFLPAFRNPHLEQLNDGAILPVAGTRLAFTTDSFVVRPLFFPGGNIGHLAVHGTVNDLAMSGARPLYLSSGYILEEGLPMSDLQRIVDSMGQACRDAGVLLVTGDTKVVDRGHGDGVYINTAGIGIVPDGVDIRADRARPGDAVIVSGAIGVHGVAILSVREGLDFDANLESDSAPLHGLVADMLSVTRDIHCLRDPTRGGLASTLHEIAQASGVGIAIEETRIPLWPQVAATCEMLGLDPLYVANEGKLVAFVPAAVAEPVLAAMRAHPYGGEAAVIGRVVEDHAGMVVMRTVVGGRRVVDLPAGELLPRIC
ncbi:MAG: hydrogenase expression/formation protein HypE [Chloroflexi bacterium]|nr:hydrogenase expression/formation protein HypE [Chloroflexota bacterium]